MSSIPFPTTPGSVLALMDEAYQDRVELQMQAFARTGKVVPSPRRRILPPPDQKALEDEWMRRHAEWADAIERIAGWELRA